MKINLKTLGKLTGLYLCVLSTGLSAAHVQEIMGDTVIFRWFPEDVDPKYGTIQVIGDTIFVTPTNFRAESTNGEGTVNSNGTGTIQIIAKPGYVLDGIDFGEKGDYLMTPTADSVGVAPWLRVFDYSDPVFGLDETLNVPVTGDLTIKDGVKHNWEAAGGFDLTTAAWDNIDYVGLTLQNDLSATTSGVGPSSAWIQKKVVGSSVVVSTSPVPVPAAVWLFGSGLLGLVGIARRKI